MVTLLSLLTRTDSKEVFSKLKFALNAVPGTVVNTLQSFVSIRRIEKYLCSPEVDSINALDNNQSPIALDSATVGWPQEKNDHQESISTISSTSHRTFSLVDVTLEFPIGKLSLVCGKLGSGKTLLLQCLSSLLILFLKREGTDDLQLFWAKLTFLLEPSSVLARCPMLSRVSQALFLRQRIGL